MSSEPEKMKFEDSPEVRAALSTTPNNSEEPAKESEDDGAE